MNKHPNFEKERISSNFRLCYLNTHITDTESGNISKAIQDNLE